MVVSNGSSNGSSPKMLKTLAGRAGHRVTELTGTITGRCNECGQFVYLTANGKIWISSQPCVAGEHRSFS